MSKLFAILFLSQQILSLKELTAKEFDSSIQNQHVFVIACTEEGNECEKFKNDFTDEWEIFNFKFAKVFSSKLFEITKRGSDNSFFNQITNNAQTSVIVYIERQNLAFKRVIDPTISSQRTLRNWLRTIESDFAEKVIDQKIEELDKVINQNRASRKPQQKDLQEADNQVSEDNESAQVEEDKNEDSEEDEQKDDEKSSEIPPTETAVVTSEITEEIVEFDDDGKEEIQSTLTKLDKDGNVVSENTIKEDQDLIELEKEINQEEVKSQNYREIDVHDLNVDDLDEQEVDSLTHYLQKVQEQNKDVLSKYQKRVIPTVSSDSQSSLQGKVSLFKQGMKKAKELKQTRKAELNFEDLDLSKLNNEQIEMLKNHFDERKQKQKEMNKLFQEEFVNNPTRGLVAPEDKEKAILNKKAKELYSKMNEQPAKPQPESMVTEHVVGVWVYIGFLLLLLLVIIRVFSFYQQQTKKQSQHKFYTNYDVEENTAIVEEI